MQKHWVKHLQEAFSDTFRWWQENIKRSPRSFHWLCSLYMLLLSRALLSLIAHYVKTTGEKYWSSSTYMQYKISRESSMNLREKKKCEPDRSIDTARLTMSLVHFVLSCSRFWSKQPEFRSFSVCLPRSHWCAKLRQGVSSCLRETRSIDTSSMLIELHRDHCVRWTERLPLQRFSIHSTGETESIQRWSRSSARLRTNAPWCGRRRRNRMALIAEMEFFVTSEAIFHRFV